MARLKGNGMDPSEFVNTRMRRCMAQTLQEFEQQVEAPLREIHGTLTGAPALAVAQVLEDCEKVKHTFRKKLQAFAADCADLMPSGVQINAFEPVRR
jgi:hypothetical protein